VAVSPSQGSAAVPAAASGTGAAAAAMAVVNVNSLLSGKDSRWLQLEVCREFQRNKCSRTDQDCKFAHPPPNVEIQNGKVTACYDSIKARCNREKPPCKYFHPPQHLKDQLLINGRNHLALKNALLQQMGFASAGHGLGQSSVPTVSNSYLPGVGAFNPYLSAPIMPTATAATLMAQDQANLSLSVQQHQAAVAAQQKINRANERIEVDMTANGPYYYERIPMAGMYPLKRPATAGEKSGMPVFQQASAYQQLLQQSPGATTFVPVSFVDNNGVAINGTVYGIGLDGLTYGYNNFAGY